MDDNDPTPLARKSKRGTSAFLIEWWREGGAGDEDERDRALRGNLWDISQSRRKLGAFAGLDRLVSLLRRHMRNDDN